MNRELRNGLIIAGVAVVVVTQRRSIYNFLSRITNLTIDWNNEKYLKELHPVAEARFRKFLTQVEKKTGWKAEIQSGYRSFRYQQEEIIDRGIRPAASPGYSWHNYGMALDLNFVKDGQRLTKYTDRSTWENSGIPAIARQMNLYWGIPGDFVHFDMRTQYSIDGMLANAIERWGDDWDDIKGNRVKLARA